MRVHGFTRLGLVAALLALPATVVAQGFGVNEISSCAMARGYAATGSPCKDASTIYWNPAYAAMLSGNSLVVGATSISVNEGFVRDSSLGSYKGNPPTTIVPHLFFNHRQNDQFSWGLGVYVPYGLTSQWKSDFPGRFVAMKAAIATMYIQPNFAWKLNDNWAIGVGPVIGYSSVDLIQSLDLSQQVAAVEPGVGAITFGQLGIAGGTEFARGTVKGNSMSYGFALGFFGKLSDHWTVGGRYLSSLNFKYSNGKATFAQIPTGLTLSDGNPLGAPAGTPVDALVASQFTSGALVNQKATTELVHPDQAEIGFGYDGFNGWLLSADYYWVGWKRLHQIPVNFANPALGTQTQIEDYTNSSAIRLGAQYTAGNDWQYRFGYSGVAAAVPDASVTPTLPGQDQANYTAGVGIPIGHSFHLDASYAYVWTPGRRGRIVNRTSRSQTAEQLNDGVFTVSANVISLSLRASF